MFIFNVLFFQGAIINIYVANVANSVTEEMLKNAFQEYGQVKSVRIIKDRFTGESRGFAFVEMSETEGAEAAISGMNGKELGGKQLRVNEARERDVRTPRSGTDRGRFTQSRRSGNGFGKPGSRF